MQKKKNRKISLWGSRKNINTNIEIGVSRGRVAGVQGWDWASLVAQIVKNLPAMQEPWVQYLGREDPLEKEMAPHSSILSLENSMDRGAWWATVHGVSELDTTELLTHTHIHTHTRARMHIHTHTHTHGWDYVSVGSCTHTLGFWLHPVCFLSVWEMT